MVAVAAWGLWSGLRRRVPSLPPPPSPPSGVAAAPVRFDDFVGSERCAACHPPQFETWSRSTHGRAGGPPASVRVLAPFGGRPIQFRDARVIPQRTADAVYRFSVEQPGRPAQVFQVVAVIGGGHLVGGGTQGFVAGHADGTLRFLPFDYSATDRVWFCNTGGRSNRGWVPITPDLPLAACGDWPPSRVLGGVERFQNCQQCHGSQITVAFDAEARRYSTRFTSLTVNCESCHGPGRRHLEWASSADPSGDADIGMEPLGVLDKDASLERCLQCHALKQELEVGYLPGGPFALHFSLKLAMLGAAPLLPDGRVRTFAYQEGHLASDCYRNGSMSCVDCHDPHAQTYRDHTGRALEGRLNDGQCLSCHPSKADPASRHTRHAPGSIGSRCVACHMPYLQHPSVGTAVRYARSDHTIGIPRPALDEALGVRGACAQCHLDRPAAELRRQLEARYGEPKPQSPPVAGLLEAQRRRDRDAATDLVLAGTGEYPLAEFAGLSHFLIRYLAPDLPDLPSRIVDRLAQASERGDDDVAALALASLHLARGGDPAVRRRLAARLRALGPRETAVRRRWAATLRRVGEGYRVGGEPLKAATAYRRALEVLPDAASLEADLARALTEVQQYDSAVTHFRRSLALRPSEPLTLVGLAHALIQRGDFEGGMAAYHEAARANSQEALVFLSMGNAYLSRRRVGEAVEALQRAVALDPGLAEAHFGLATAYGRLGDRPKAADAARRGLEFDPGSAGGRRLLEELTRD